MVVELQLDLNNLNTWCEDNDMILNVTKCQVINFSRKVPPTYTKQLSHSIDSIEIRNQR
jgi:hypothetical protein